MSIMTELQAGRLFTRILEEMAGSPVTAEVERGPDVLSGEEGAQLGARPGWPCVRRQGILRAGGGAPAALIAAVLLPERVPDHEVRTQLDRTTIPLGLALEPFGLEREVLDVRGGEGEVSLHVRARLWLPCPCRCGNGQWAAALVTEGLLASFADKARAPSRGA
jgi:hypothetical protein